MGFIWRMEMGLEKWEGESGLREFGVADWFKKLFGEERIY